MPAGYRPFYSLFNAAEVGAGLIADVGVSSLPVAMEISISGEATVRVDASADGSRWIDISDGGYTASRTVTLDTAIPYYRAVVTDYTSGLVNAIIGSGWTGQGLMANIGLYDGPISGDDMPVSACPTPVWFNIKCYGAIGNGIADDSAVIQEAVDAASAAGGGVVYAPPGIYLVATAISCPDFVSVIGDGADSTRFRAAGNNFIFDLNPANRTRFSGFTIDAATEQASGGGFDYTNAAAHVYIDHLYVFSNLFSIFNITPEASCTNHFFDTIRIFGQTTGTAFKLAPAAGIILSNLYVSNFIGTANPHPGGVLDWFSLSTAASGSAIDSLIITDSVVFQGTNGLTTTGASKITGCKFVNFSVDTQIVGLQLDNVLDWTFQGCAINTCGDATTPSIQIGANAHNVTIVGTTIQHGPFVGVEIANGAVYTSLSSCKIINNNNDNHAGGDGISVAAGASKFRISDCTIGNTEGGHTKTGINVAVGGSDGYIISGNTLVSNETAAVTDGGTGINKLVDRNLTV